MSASQPPVPFTVIGGFLGSGKTTLLNQILRDAAGERIMILVNDVGDTPIDPELIASRNANMIAVTNGCICCSLGDEFALSLPDLLTMVPRIDRVVVEASGIGDPGRIAQYGTLPGFALDGVIVLADAEGIVSLSGDRRIGHQVTEQLRRAHLVAMTKIDLVSTAVRESARACIAEAVEGLGIPILEIAHGRIPREILFGLGSDPVGGPPAQDSERSLRPHGVDVRMVHVPNQVGRSELDAWLKALSEDVLRVKGVVNLSTGTSVVVQKVGPRCRITKCEGQVKEPRLVVISIAGTEIYEPAW